MAVNYGSVNQVREQVTFTGYELQVVTLVNTHERPCSTMFDNISILTIWALGR